MVRAFPGPCGPFPAQWDLMRAIFVLLLALVPTFSTAFAQRAQPEIAVEARNHSTPELCAERDNVQIDFVSPEVRSFRLQATHPAYIGTISVDRWAPDFSSCGFEEFMQFGDDGERVTLYETPSIQLVGYKLGKFWRPANTPIRVGDKTFTGMHAVQLWLRFRERAEEVVVFYPPDGYWRMRPYPFQDMRWTAYGSSFLIGPVEIQERPIVDIKEIVFDPASRTFDLQFRRGGSARLNLQKVDQEHISFDVSLAGLPAGMPFATLRSMFATEINSDVARAGWRVKGGDSWLDDSIMKFPGGMIAEFWAGRRLPSRHNTSAPDMSFSRFSAAAAAK